MSPRTKTIFHFFGSFLLLGTLPMLLDSAQTPMGHWGQTTLRTRRWGQRHWGQATLRTDNVEDRQRWGQATLRTGDLEDKFIPQYISQLYTYILKCWQQISNKICSFHKQKPSKLHIFSECWQHISNKTFIPKVLASYIQYILKCWQHISNKICSFPKQKPS